MHPGYITLVNDWFVFTADLVVEKRFIPQSLADPFVVYYCFPLCIFICQALQFWDE